MLKNGQLYIIFFCIVLIIILDFKIKLATERANRIYDDNVYINIYLNKKSNNKNNNFHHHYHLEYKKKQNKQKINKKLMDFCNKVLSKAPVSWPDVQKQLFTVMQSRTSSMSSNYGSSVNSLGFNKASVKQCTDLLIKHIKSNSIFFGQNSYKFLIN